MKVEKSEIGHEEGKKLSYKNISEMPLKSDKFVKLLPHR